MCFLNAKLQMGHADLSVVVKNNHIKNHDFETLCPIALCVYKMQTDFSGYSQIRKFNLNFLFFPSPVVFTFIFTNTFFSFNKGHIRHDGEMEHR